MAGPPGGSYFSKDYQSLSEPEAAAFWVIPSDNPVTKKENDKLQRADLAEAFAQHILSFDVSHGLAVALLGPWGSGKTSFLHFLQQIFEERGVSVMHFNPWMFRGVEQLVDRFFSEIAAELQRKPDLANNGEQLSLYAEVISGVKWLPVIGPWLGYGGEVAKVPSRMLQGPTVTVRARRDELIETLHKLNKTFAVVLDDVDRLSDDEIRGIFKLIRPTANFPNVIYLVAFDRERVEQDLTERDVPRLPNHSGRQYLEKVFQATFDLPPIPPRNLASELSDSIEDVRHNVRSHGPFDEDLWLDVREEIVLPLIKNLRDVRRYAAAVHFALVAVRDRVASVDVLALEAVRVFLADVFARLHGAIEALTMTASVSDKQHSVHRAQLQQLQEMAGEHSGVVRAMIDRLFYAAKSHLNGLHHGPEWKSHWYEERRVAHEEFLRLYLKKVAGELMSIVDKARRAVCRMSRRDEFEECLLFLAPEERRELISTLHIWEDHFLPEYAVPAITVLLNMFEDLPMQTRNVFELRPCIIVARLVLRSPATTLAVLRSTEDEMLSWTPGSRAMQRVHRLQWDELVAVYGDEATVEKRIDALKKSELEVPNDLLQLADRYLAGWRPVRDK